MRGQFVIHPDTPEQFVIPNSVLTQGEETFLKMITQDDHADLAGGANFYIGLCGKVFDNDTDLTTLAGEPAVSHGYARQSAARNNVGFPNIVKENGIWKAQSRTATFTAAGGDFSLAIWRTFLCNVNAGSGGRLFSVSGAFDAALLITNGNTLNLRYELFIR